MSPYEDKKKKNRLGSSMLLLTAVKAHMASQHALCGAETSMLVNIGLDLKVP